MEKDATYIKTEMSILGISNMENLKDMVSSFGMMVQFMKETLLKERNVVEENGEDIRMTLIAISMKGNTKMKWKTDMESLNGKQETYIRANIEMM